MILFIILISMLLTYLLKEQLIAILEFLFDNILGKIVEKLISWIKPLESGLKNICDKLKSKLDAINVLGSIFLFLVTLVFSIANTVLMYYAFELFFQQGVRLTEYIPSTHGFML